MSGEKLLLSLGQIEDQLLCECMEFNPTRRKRQKSIRLFFYVAVPAVLLFISFLFFREELFSKGQQKKSEVPIDESITYTEWVEQQSDESIFSASSLYGFTVQNFSTLAKSFSEETEQEGKDNNSGIRTVQFDLTDGNGVTASCNIFQNLDKPLQQYKKEIIGTGQNVKEGSLIFENLQCSYLEVSNDSEAAQFIALCQKSNMVSIFFFEKGVLFEQMEAFLSMLLSGNND